jgi:hypothetical protein
MELSISSEATVAQLLRKIPRVHKFEPLEHILSQSNPVHTITRHLFEMHHNIIFPSAPGYSRTSAGSRRSLSSEGSNSM